MNPASEVLTAENDRILRHVLGTCAAAFSGCLDMRGGDAVISALLVAQQCIPNANLSQTQHGDAGIA